MSLHLVTGYAGEEHVTSADQGSFNAAIMGEGEFVLERGNQFAASIISNNKVRVLDGDILMQGRQIRLVEDTYEELNFENGTQGYKRNDLIVARYTKDSTTGIETSSLVVIKGTPAESSPVDPEYTHGDIIHEHDLLNEMPLYRVPFDGFNTVPTWETLKTETVSELTEQVEQLIENANNEIDEAIGELCKIVVTTDEQLVGQTITCTQGTRTYAAVVDNTQTVTFGVPVLGTWTLHNPITGNDVEVETIYYGRYTASLSCFKVYGVDIDFSITNPTSMCTYTDDAIGMVAGSSDWWAMPIFESLKSCILVNGAVLGYLNEDDVSKYVGGTAADITTLGNDVMLELGVKIGYSIEWKTSTVLSVKVTDEQGNSDFNYDAFSLDVYDDCDKIYIGRYKGHVSGGKLYSSSGKSVAVSQTIDTFRGYARARGTGYQQRSYASVKLMQCLYIIFNGTLASQATTGMGYVLSSHTAGISTGGGNAYGKNSEVIKATNPSYMTDQNHHVVALMLEDFWGNYWEFVDGLCSDANRNILTCKCAANFDTDGTGYDNNGNGGVSANIGNYMSRPQGGSNAGFMPQTVAGSDSTYFCDYAALSASCLAIFGGYWSNAAYAGAFRLYVFDAFSLSSAYVGARLMYLHKAA